MRLYPFFDFCVQDLRYRFPQPLHSKIKEPLLLGLLLLAPVLTSHAADVLVTNTNDNGAGSLRNAIAVANPGDTIYFDPALAGMSLSLSTGELLINKNLTIFGLGPFNTFISGGPSRAFQVTAGVNVTLAHMQIGGTATGGTSGGAIINHGELTLKNIALVGAFATNQGGGVYSDGPRLTLRNCLLDSNSANTGGGGIYMAAGTLELQNTSLVGNATAGGSGGGIYLTGSTMAFLTASLLRINTANNVAGGGLFNDGATVTITNSTVSGNTAKTLGGGLANLNSGMMTVQNSTVAANQPCSAACPGLQGGGIYNPTGSTVALYSTIIADNTAALGPDLNGSFTSNGFNLVTDITGSAGIVNGVGGDQVNPTSGLNGLTSSGGPTIIHTLQATSPAVDQGECPALNTDQRGYHNPTTTTQRIVDSAPADASDGCDVGAYELGAVQDRALNLDATVLLSGAYDAGGMMTTDLATAALLPTNQPFSGPPWNYSGTETLGTTTDITDWVLVEFRTANATGSPDVYRKAGLLRKDGSIRAASGVGFIRIGGMDALDRYFNVVIYTRNHLSIMSAYPVELIANLKHNFTDASYRSWGVNATNEIAVGIFAKWGGDGNADGNVTAFDFLNVWLPINGGPMGYNAGDFNLDGSATAFDFLNVWLPANGQATQVP